MTDALKLAADDGDLKEVRHLVEEEHVPITQADAWGDTALHAAVAKGRLGMTITALINMPRHIIFITPLNPMKFNFFHFNLIM